MSGISSSDAKKPMEQSNNDLSEVMRQLSVTSNETSTQPKNLSDMPIDVVGLIIERSDYKRQLILRKVSKSLRALVDKQKPACKSIQVVCHAKNVNITYNNHFVIYTDNGDFYKRPGRKVGKDFEKVAFDDLASTLNNPKLQLETFWVVDCLGKEESKKYYNERNRIFESLNHELFVKGIKLFVQSSSWLHSILPHLKPGFLERISLVLIDGTDWRFGMDQVARLEQWKQAKELKTCYPFEKFPMEYATHFKRYVIDEHVLEGDMLIRIREFLSKLGNFEYCYIPAYCLDIIEEVQEMIGIPVPPNMSHYSIPDSDYCLEFSFTVDGIIIVKKICHSH